MAPVNVRAQVGFFLFFVLLVPSSHRHSLRARSAIPPSIAATDNYMVCWSTGDPVAYFSDIFNAPPPPPGPRGRQGNQLGEVFLAFLKSKYSVVPNDHAICGSPSTMAQDKAQTYKDQMEARMKQTGKKIVETGWKYTQ